MDEYASKVRSYEDNQAFFEEQPQLLHEHAMGYLLMEALQLGMDNKMARRPVMHTPLREDAGADGCMRISYLPGCDEARRQAEVSPQIAARLC